MVKDKFIIYELNEKSLFKSFNIFALFELLVRVMLVLILVVIKLGKEVLVFSCKLY